MNKGSVIRNIVAICLCFALFNTQAMAHDDELFEAVEIKDGSNLNIVNCVALAFQNSPKIKKQKYNLDIASSNLGIARSKYFPEFGAGVGYFFERNSNSVYYDKRYRELPNVGISVNKMIWDFGKTTAFVKMEEFYKIAAEYEFMDSLCETLFDIKAKYYEVLKDRAMVQIAQNNIALSKYFVEISRPGADITAAKYDLGSAEIDSIKIENNYKNAKVNLANAMYLNNLPNFNIINTPTFKFDNDYYYKDPKIKKSDFKPQEFPFSREKAVDVAYESSPDLKVLEATKNAMIQSLQYVKRTYFPELNTNAGYGYLNTNQASDSSFRVGVNLESKVNLMELKHSIKGADAEVNLAQNEIDLFKKDLYFEVQRAFNNVDKSLAEVAKSEENVKASLNNLEIVPKKYINKEDDVDYYALQDARDNYIEAMYKYVESLYDYNMALIQVEMATHSHIVDIHHKSEHAVTFHTDELLEHINKVLGCEEKETGRKFKFKKDKENL